MVIPVEKLNGIKRILDHRFEEYHKSEFIKSDPIVVPHSFNKKQDIEIAAFFAAILAWGNRSSIIRSARRIMELMHMAPYDFVLHHEERDLKPMLAFVHRTFNATDLLYTISFFKHHYQQYSSMEQAFFPNAQMNVQEALIHFHHYFFSLPYAPERTRKHIATPEKKSACKRLNMFFRWMLRQESPVDFGIWRSVAPSQLICPLDTHVGDVARKLGLLQRKQNDWAAALQLTEALRLLDPEDPVRYDYALFSLGVAERF